MKSDRKRGQVITFYSYKGGTGRSMALANVACLLAKGSEGDKQVLMIDWDLEAPGLHRFFRDLFQNEGGTSPDRYLEEQPGLMDLFDRISERTHKSEYASAETARALFESVDLQHFALRTDIENLHLLKAGRFDERYPWMVNHFQWQELYDRVPWLISAFAELLSEQYDYVLIDSRTGVTDISGVCTMLMPEKLVAVFTPNRQSLLGLLDVVRRATTYRK